ncbi:MAG: glycosyltransferase family 2 protein [Pirellula sp.]
MFTSLLIPCYNSSRFLGQLKEVVDKIDPAFDEVLLIDDASTDSTLAIAKELGFTIIESKKNLGPGGARNVLAQHARGEWIRFLDSDDLIAPNFLEVVLPELHIGHDVIVCGGLFLDEKNKVEISRWIFDQASFSDDSVRAAFISPVPTFCSVIRRKAFIAIQGFDTKRRCWEDGDMHLRLAAAGANFKIVTEVLATSLRHDSGASSNHGYCHRCRLEFIENYIDQRIPISNDVFQQELLRIGFLLMYSRQYQFALRAYALVEKLGGDKVISQNPYFRLMLRYLPVRFGHFISAAIKSIASKGNNLRC